MSAPSARVSLTFGETGAGGKDRLAQREDPHGGSRGGEPTAGVGRRSRPRRVAVSGRRCRFDRLHLGGEAVDPGVGHALRRGRIRRLGCHPDLGGVQRDLHADGAEQGVGRGLQLQRGDDPVSHEPRLGHGLVVLDLCLGQAVPGQGKAHVVRSRRHHNAAGIGRVDLGLKRPSSQTPSTWPAG